MSPQSDSPDAPFSLWHIGVQGFRSPARNGPRRARRQGFGVKLRKQCEDPTGGAKRTPKIIDKQSSVAARWSTAASASKGAQVHSLRLRRSRERGQLARRFDGYDQ
jgi:hypothetical protein